MNKASLIFIVLFIFIVSACSSEYRGPASIEMSFETDSSKHAENFGVFIIHKMRFLSDSMLSRINYPFTYTEIIGSRDWKMTKFENLAGLQSAQIHSKLRKVILNDFNFDDRFKRIFAVDSVRGQSLSVTYFKGSERGLYFHFIVMNGKWYMNSLQELPLIDGHLPIEK